MRQSKKQQDILRSYQALTGMFMTARSRKPQATTMIISWTEAALQQGVVAQLLTSQRRSSTDAGVQCQLAACK